MDTGCSFLGGGVKRLGLGPPSSRLRMNGSKSLLPTPGSPYGLMATTGKPLPHNILLAAYSEHLEQLNTVFSFVISTYNQVVPRSATFVAYTV